LLNSKKDRWGLILLLFVALAYWFLSRPNLFKNTQWEFTETPLSRKPAQTGPQQQNYRPSHEWNDRREAQRSPGFKTTWSFKKFRHDSSRGLQQGFPNRLGTISRKAPLAVSLNASDSTLWEQLPGIGPVLAARIIKYRDKLGGFHSVTQLREVYGIADSVYEKISPVIKTDHQALHKIDLNKASLEELNSHPYLRWKIAQAIIRYREANGPFQSLEDLKKIWSLSAETILKIEPYLLVETDSLLVQ
jgi:competence ComEA-like helix-hairpin-helix protein